MKIIALVPIKENSERLLGKNFLDFNGRPLYTIVLQTLEACDLVEKIVINTDSEEVARFAKNTISKSKIIERPEHLLDNTVTMNTIIDYDLSQIEGDHYLQTHVTNPLLTLESIEDAITRYFENFPKHDSLISVTPIKKRVYDSALNPINHSNKQLLMTQDLPEVYVENSNLFLFSRKSFLQTKSRIGTNPWAYKMSEIESIDIDYREDFELAKLLDLNNVAFFNSRKSQDAAQTSQLKSNP